MNNISKIIIDLNYLKILNININQLLTLIKIYFTSKKEYFDYEIDIHDINFLRENKYIFVEENKTIKYHLRDKGNIIINKIIEFNNNETIEIEKIKEEEVIDNFSDKVKQFRLKFNGLRTGSMGTLGSVKSKLKRWMEDNPKVTFNQILEAVDLYIDSLNGNYNYLQRADYFIYKQNNKKEEDSRLSIFIDELNKEPENSDWTTEIK